MRASFRDLFPRVSTIKEISLEKAQTGHIYIYDGGSILAAFI